jgi:hypothetical protein
MLRAETFRGQKTRHSKSREDYILSNQTINSANQLNNDSECTYSTLEAHEEIKPTQRSTARQQSDKVTDNRKKDLISRFTLLSVYQRQAL